MLVTEFGIVTEVIAAQDSNAREPMLRTELGMVTDVTFEPKSASSPIEVTEYTPPL